MQVSSMRPVSVAKITAKLYVRNIPVFACERRPPVLGCLDHKLYECGLQLQPWMDLRISRPQFRVSSAECSVSCLSFRSLQASSGFGRRWFARASFNIFSLSFTHVVSYQTQTNQRRMMGTALKVETKGTPTADRSRMLMR